METTGRLASVQRDFATGKPILSFVVNTDSDDEIEYLSEQEKLSIKAVRYSEKRSLSANAYFHVLVGKMAALLHIPNVEVKNRLIREYGAYEFIDEHIPTFRLKAEYEDAMLNRDGFHVITIGREYIDGCEWVRMAMMRGSHTYSTTEMSRLIDGTVAEAKALGIETLTPDELERMKATWSIGQSTA